MREEGRPWGKITPESRFAQLVFTARDKKDLRRERLSAARGVLVSSAVVTTRRIRRLGHHGGSAPASAASVTEIAVLTLTHDGVVGQDQSPAFATDPIARIVGQAFDAACDTFSAANEARLRDIVFLFVTRLKAAALPPERVLIAMKSALTLVGDGRPPSLADSLGNAGNPTRHRAYNRVFQWVLEAYYGDRTDSRE